MTNADKIRGMTDEQLAKWLDIEEELCGEQWQKWVKQEHKSNSF